MKPSTLAVVVIGLAIALVGVLAIAKALTPRPKSSFEILAGIAPALLDPTGGLAKKIGKVFA